MTSSANIDALWQYPVKGFSAQRVDQAYLQEDAFFPGDRLFTLEVGSSGFEPRSPKVISKMKFAVLARFASVARLRSFYFEADQVFQIQDGTRVERFNLASEQGRSELAHFVEDVLSKLEDYDPLAQPLKLLESPSYDQVGTHFRFTDSGKGFVSILNLNSLRDLSRRLGVELDPTRLRANIWMEGVSPFTDHSWVGRYLNIGTGGLRLEVLKPIVRCVATHVNPETAARDVDVCTGLWENYGHRDCGIYARIVATGTASSGDQINLM